jgi:hypothetical protein
MVALAWPHVHLRLHFGVHGRTPVLPLRLPGQNPHAIFLIALSVVIGGGAALLIYREVQSRTDITAFLKAVIAMAIVIAGVYAEFTVAMDVIAWLARRGR